MTAYKAGFLAAKFDSPIDRLRSDWQFNPPYNGNKIDDTYFRKGNDAGRAMIGAPSLEEMEDLNFIFNPAHNMRLDQAIDRGLIIMRESRTPPEILEEIRKYLDANKLRQAFNATPQELADAANTAAARDLLSTIPDFDPSWDYL